MINDLLLYLIIYSFLGWCCETFYCSFGEGHFVNRGFLNGPFCPIYGFGALSTLFGLQYFNKSVLWVFVGGMVITSALEYITSFAMEKLFHAKWWDYKDRPFNINGRVCLLNSTLFGLLCIVLQFDLHPLIKTFVGYFSHDFKLGFLFAFLIYFAVDLATTIHSVLGIKLRTSAISRIRAELLEAYDFLNQKLSFEQITAKLKDKQIIDERLQKLNEKILENHFFERRILKAFPHLKLQKDEESLLAVLKNLDKRGSKN